MIESRGYAAQDLQSNLLPFDFQRRNVSDDDILIDIAYCGVCHSDIHQVRNEWGASLYPMVPGHEIVGRVSQVGSNVTKFKIGDIAGVGCLVNSCQRCASCHENLEQFCEKGPVLTYNSHEYNSDDLTFGGYSNNIVVRENFALRISPKLDLSRVAPLLCAGITTYSPLRYWMVAKGQRVGVVGLGGLGHMALKLTKSFGANVVLFTRDSSKSQDALALGADEVVISKDKSQMEGQLKSFDLMIDTVSATHDISEYLNLLKRDGTLVMIGLPDSPQTISIGSLVVPRRKLVGSLIGGIRETQEMLDYCADHGILADVEVIPIAKVNEAYERMLKSDVKYRFVIDMSTL